MKVRVVGPYFGNYGYAVHVRGLCKGLARNGVDVRVGSPMIPGWERGVTDEELGWFKKPDELDEVLVIVNTPPSWRFGMASHKKAVVGFLVWEGTKIPKYWVRYVLDSRLSQVWVPSQHTKTALLNTCSASEAALVSAKLFVVPHGVDTEQFHVTSKVPGPFTFFVNKGWVHDTEDRGGTQYAVRAFLEEFRDDPNVRMVVKVNRSYIGDVDFSSWVSAKLAALGVQPAKNLVFLLDDLDAAGLNQLYNDSDVYVCATRAEAFNLAGLEAHACGVPTIQTNFGGQAEYMTIVDKRLTYDLVEVTHDITHEGNSWAVPNFSSLRLAMRSFYEAERISDETRAFLIKNASKYTWVRTGEIAVKALEGVYTDVR